jgi:hypothetical protein
MDEEGREKKKTQQKREIAFLKGHLLKELWSMYKLCEMTEKINKHRHYTRSAVGKQLFF